MGNNDTNSEIHPTPDPLILALAYLNLITLPIHFLLYCVTMTPLIVYRKTFKGPFYRLALCLAVCDLYLILTRYQYGALCTYFRSCPFSVDVNTFLYTSRQPIFETWRILLLLIAINRWLAIFMP